VNITQSMNVQDIVYRTKNIFEELNIKCDCIVINIDSKAFIFNSENETINQKSRHKDIRYHHIRELIKEN